MFLLPQEAEAEGGKLLKPPSAGADGDVELWVK